jgi:hypothetical protein
MNGLNKANEQNKTELHEMLAAAVTLLETLVPQAAATGDSLLHFHVETALLGAQHALDQIMRGR